MKTPHLSASLCLLGGLLLGTPAPGQQEPRSVILTPPTARKSGGAPSAQAQSVSATPKRYWADYKANAIRRSNLDGSNVETLSEDAEGPYGLGADPETGYLIWTNSTSGTVQTSPPEASDQVITLPTAFEPPYALIFKGKEQDVAYGVDEGQLVRITRDRYTGVEQRDVLLQLSSPEQVHGLALSPDGKALYLGDFEGRMSQKLNLADLKQLPILHSEGEVPAGPAPKSTLKSAPAKSAPKTSLKSAPKPAPRTSPAEKTR